MAAENLLEDGDHDWSISDDLKKALAEKYNDRSCALFLDEVPNDISENADLQALSDIFAENNDPLKFADQCRKAGNECLVNRTRKRHCTDAILFYSRGIEAGCDDETLNAVLYSNRAQAYLFLKRYQNCVDDARVAIKKNPKEVKTYYRAALGSFLLELYEQALDFCTQGLVVDASSSALQELQQKAKLNMQVRQQTRTEQSKAQRTKENESFSKVQEICKQRHLKLSDESPYGESIDSLLRSSPVYVDDEGRIHWPALCLYDEVAISEFICDFDEGSCLEDHLKVMFPGDRFVEWDVGNRYVWNQLIAFYDAGSKSDVQVQVSEKVQLRHILDLIKHVSRIPVFHIFVKGSDALLRFQQEHECISLSQM